MWHPVTNDEEWRRASELLSIINNGCNEWSCLQFWHPTISGYVKAKTRQLYNACREDPHKHGSCIRTCSNKSKWHIGRKCVLGNAHNVFALPLRVWDIVHSCLMLHTLKLKHKLCCLETKSSKTYKAPKYAPPLHNPPPPTHACTHARTRAHILTHTHTHARARARTHAHTVTHKHMVTKMISRSDWF